MSIKLVPNHNSYKIGIDEIVGLKQAMKQVMAPIRQALKDKIYWNDCSLEESEYKSRDGFIPHSHNCGGIELMVIVPKCEEYAFKFLEFGECDDDECNHDERCIYEDEGHLDAKLRIWLKFEGIDEETQSLQFYLYMGGGNDDAPYFRARCEADIFEAEFTCKSVAGLKRAASKHVKALLKIVSQ